ncbi:MAG: aminotransferase class I/II-fold pyridoxal phosphate-dependent enzyme [Rhodovibrionaceae bacterium]|nr:aminotransferase class I/II-fold pyridoxal phosphate-dependent enzyme [Rhodovibrionaceae bacterium]
MEGDIAGPAPGKRSLSRYYNASQLRADTWQRLKHYSIRLAERNLSARETEKHRKAAAEALGILEPVETYWAFPGQEAFAHLRYLFQKSDYDEMSRFTGRAVRAMVSGSFRRRKIELVSEQREDDEAHDYEAHEDFHEQRPVGRSYFEIMVVDSMSPAQQISLRRGLHAMRRPEDAFTYETVVVPSLEDALIGVLLNPQIQSVIIRYDFPLKSQNTLPPVQRELKRFDLGLQNADPTERGLILAEMLGELRPELDVFLVTDLSVEEIAVRVPANVKRVFYQQEDFLELHLNILRSINKRFRTPFFTALREYSKQPTGVFHAMPISRGKSITKSNWIRDMGEFYGMNIFLAETSATSGGLDSLLDPHGPIKEAQELAARAFHSQHTYFVTNGTSTANKVVVQSLVTPGDIVLVDRDCHKSHHYGIVLAGAEVVYLDSYPLDDFSMYGAVPLHEIKARLLELKAAGKLERVKLLLLTNCTFDGIVYNVERVMEECLAIKPDLVFLWDEAWFAFASLGPTYRQRTAMWTAHRLRKRYASEDYRKRYEAQQAELKGKDDASLLETRLLPDPDRVRVRAYATQSTHKTLTSLRQGSMIHVHDQDFRHKVEDAFHEAYMTHTSTSPNYQIVASLDVGRRQVELEGFELIQKQVEMAMVLRERVTTHPLLAKYFRFLTVKDLIPASYRQSGIEAYYNPEQGWTEFWEAWANDEFVLDPTRLTLYLGLTGIDGDSFKNSYLMDKYGIQINKTSRNTVLFMTNIGTTRSSVAYLIEVLIAIARELEEGIADMSRAERAMHDRRIHSLSEELPPLPDFSRFHDRFRLDKEGTTPEGLMREAFFLSYKEEACEYLGLTDGSIDEAMANGREVVSAMFVIPYPPGFPILVPGQVISAEILAFMRALDVKEIHGYRPDLGLRVFTEAALAESKPQSKAAE